MSVKLPFFIVFSFLTPFVFSQVKEVEIEIIESEEVEVYQNAVEVFGYATTHFGERQKALSFGGGGYYFQYFPSRLFLKFGLGFGDIKFYGNNNTQFDNRFYGAEFGAGLFLFNQVDYHKKSKFMNPYIGLGINGLRSEAVHYNTQSRIDIGFSGALGVDFKLTNSLQAGILLNASYMLSDQIDDVTTSSQYDILFRPGITVKYIFGKNKTTKHYHSKQTIKRKNQTGRDFGTNEFYEEKRYEPYVNVTVSDDEIENNSTPAFYNKDNKNASKVNTSHASNFIGHENLFYTIQIGAYYQGSYLLKPLVGIKEDFVFHDKNSRLYHYLYGVYGSSAEAFSKLDEIKKAVPDAFVTSVYKSEKLPAWKAEKIEQTEEDVINTQNSKQFIKTVLND